MSTMTSCQRRHKRMTCQEGVCHVRRRNHPGVLQVLIRKSEMGNNSSTQRSQSSLSVLCKDCGA
ncbi:hypothetical protein PAMP_015227 [Pampus punctatissimus]